MKEKIKVVLGKLGRMKLLIMAIVLVGGGFGIYGIYQLVQGSDSSVRASTSGNLYIEEVVSTGDIVVGITEIGTVSLNTIDYVYEFTTIIEESYVSAGEYVEEGTVLALINTDSFEDGYTQLEAELETAQLQYQELSLAYATSKLSLEKTYQDKMNNGTTAESILNLSVAELESEIADIETDIADLTTSIESLYSQINALYASYGFDTLNSAVTTATTAVTTATTAVTKATTDVTTATAAVTAAQSKVDDKDAEISTAQANSESTTTLESELTTLKEDLTSKQSTLQTAQSTLTTAQTTLTAAKATLTSAEDKVSSASTDYNNTLTNLYTQLNADILSLEKKETEQATYYTTIESSKLNIQYQYDTTVSMSQTAWAEYSADLEKLDSNLADAKDAVTTIEEEMEEYLTLLNEGKVVASCNGYIMSIEEEDVEIRENVAVVTLAESEEVNIAVSIDQEDIGSLSVGMEVLVNFDAYEDYMITAILDEISITPSSGVSSSVSYDVTIVCDLENYPELVVYQGMTASTTFIQMQAQNVLLISNKCITNENGKQYVKVINEKDEVTQIQIETGFSDGFDVEVISGLNEGDVVIIESVVS